MTSLALTVAFAVLSLASDETPESELSKYQGTWVLVSEEFEGKKVPAAELADDLKGLSYTVRDDKVRLHFEGQGPFSDDQAGPEERPQDLRPVAG